MWLLLLLESSALLHFAWQHHQPLQEQLVFQQLMGHTLLQDGSYKPLLPPRQAAKASANQSLEKLREASSGPHATPNCFSQNGTCVPDSHAAPAA
jgi:hypothetical protein